jgi:hypothetical protein
VCFEFNGSVALDSERVRIKALKDQILSISVCFEFKVVVSRFREGKHLRFVRPDL